MLVVVVVGRPEYDSYSRLLPVASGIMNLRLGANEFNTAYVSHNVVINSNVIKFSYSRNNVQLPAKSPTGLRPDVRKPRHSYSLKRSPVFTQKSRTANPVY